jgi:hypothetical protein
MSYRAPNDLEPDERPLHQLLSPVPPRALPLGFRDAVMRRVTSRGVATWEWILALVLAIPALAFLAFELIDRGDEFITAANNVAAGASADAADAFFSVDGTTVFAVSLVGIACVIAAHAVIAAPARRRTLDR